MDDAFMLNPACGGFNCLNTHPAGATCQHAVAQRNDGRWFITIGHPGFNSPANNGHGYATRNTALAAYRKYSARGTRRIGRR